jgi:hypothetical protein
MKSMPKNPAYGYEPGGREFDKIARSGFEQQAPARLLARREAGELQGWGE